MNERNVTKEQLGNFVKQASSVTTIPTDASQWSALVVVDNKFYEVWTEARDGGRATIEQIAEKQFNVKLTADYRTALTG